MSIVDCCTHIRFNDTTSIRPSVRPFVRNRFGFPFQWRQRRRYRTPHTFLLFLLVFIFSSHLIWFAFCFILASALIPAFRHTLMCWIICVNALNIHNLIHANRSNNVSKVTVRRRERAFGSNQLRNVKTNGRERRCHFLCRKPKKPKN